MEIRVLKYFLAVVREESITKAAEVLHITQPTLSRQLALLEASVAFAWKREQPMNTAMTKFIEHAKCFLGMEQYKY